MVLRLLVDELTSYDDVTKHHWVLVDWYVALWRMSQDEIRTIFEGIIKVFDESFVCRGKLFFFIFIF